MQTPNKMKLKAGGYLRQGISPRRLALTLVLGFVVGCIPVVGLPTAVCAVLALAFRLNQPAIQAANYAAMPFQVALIVPLLRMGSRLLPIATRHGVDVSALARSPLNMVAQSPHMAVPDRRNGGPGAVCVAAAGAAGGGAADPGAGCDPAARACGSGG